MDTETRNPNNFLKPFVTTDETWTYHSTPVSKSQTRMWSTPSDYFPFQIWAA
ncbi:unnamed protein product, partial [Ceratitis capitata]